MSTKSYSSYTDLVNFTRASSGYALRPVSYGDELVTNGTFDTDASGWTTADSTIRSVNGEIELTVSTTGTRARAYQEISTVAGKLYQLEFELTDDSVTGTAFVSVGNQGPGSDILNQPATTLGKYVKRFVALSETTVILLTSTLLGIEGETFRYDNISVREVLFDRADGTLQLNEHPVNVPRIDYDSDGNVLGILVEEQRTNLVTNSSPGTGWSYTVGVGISQNSLEAPDATLSASTIDMQTTGGFLYTTCTVTAETTYTASWYGKPGTATKWIYAFYDESNGVFISREQYDLLAATPVVDGWYRFDIQVTTPAGCTSLRVYPTRGSDSTGGIPGAVGTTHFWGVQLEEGTFATSVMPTKGATAIRSADLILVSTNVFGINLDAGTLVANWYSLESPSVERVVVLGRSDSNDGYQIQHQSNAIVGRVREQSTDTAFMGSGSNSQSGNKAALTYSSRSASAIFVGNQGSVQTDTSIVPVSNVNTMSVGSLPLGSNELNGRIRSISYIPRNLTSAQLQRLIA